MNRKIALLSLAVIAIGLYAMPAALSLFAGQHTFDKHDTAMCRKCHSDVYDELHSSLNKIHWKNIDTRFECIECHNVTNVSAYFQTGLLNSSGTHAATTVPCLACHSGLKGVAGSGCLSCHNMGGGYYPFPMHQLAVKYGIGHVKTPPDGKDCGQCHRNAANPTAGDVYIKLINRSITGLNEVHRPFYYNASYPDNQTEIKLKDSNTACIGCHTRARVEMAWVRKGGYNYSYDFVNKTGIFNKNETNVTSYTNNT